MLTHPSDLYSMNILVVDDQSTNRRLLRAMLEAEGFSVWEASDGVEALAVLHREKIDAVISDILMPNMDGYRLCHELRRHEKFHTLPLIHYTSTYTSLGDQRLSETVGADKYLLKPAPLPDLLAALSEAMTRSEARKSTLKTAHDTAFVMKQYSAALINKLEEKNNELGTALEDLNRANQRIISMNADLEHRIEGRTKELQAANQELERRNREIENFYHTLAHELKTPLTSAREFICILLDGLAGPISETQTEYLGIARESCDQLRVCIDDLFDATRLETGKLRLERKKGCLAALSRRIMRTMRPIAERKQIDLAEDIRPGLPEVPLDEPRITQVLANLINNALKFTPSGGKIIVRIEVDISDPAHLCVSVIDSGCGVPPDELGRIFDRLYQVKSGDAATGNGIGLGLYISKELVELHGGRMRVQSQPGHGSTFSFTVPIVAPANSGYILIVDDEPAICEFVSKSLKRAGFDVTAAADSVTALEKMRAHKPDLILLDLKLGGSNGSCLLMEIRKQWELLPVVVFTGHPTGDLMQQALKYSPFTVLAKPCSPEHLVATVRGVRQRHDTTFKAKQNGDLRTTQKHEKNTHR